MIISAINICTGKDKIIEENIENQKDEILEKIYKLENSFYLSFYELITEFTVIDAYEFFVELDCQSNFFYDNINLINQERGKRFYKVMAMYHTIKILKQKRYNLDVDHMAECMYSVFDFDEAEKKLFKLLFSCATTFSSQFPALFSKSLGRYLFSKDIKNPFILAFIENFCYNSYSSFSSYLSKYISINRRITLAKEQLKENA
ncbi:MAG: hypothetical protein ACRCW1_07335 [Anaerotignaceae bacterium]